MKEGVMFFNLIWAATYCKEIESVVIPANGIVVLGSTVMSDQYPEIIARAEKIRQIGVAFF